MLNALHYSHQLLQQLTQKFPAGNFIDATLGKGHDSQFILQQAHFQGKLFAFDIQEAALAYSFEKFNQFKNFQAFLASHEQVDQYLPENLPIHGAIFNLGYLPGADHQITTQYPSTITAIEKISRQLVPQGMIIIVVYSGHPAGKIERDQLLDVLKDWSQEEYSILQYNFINQKNNPPFTLVIEKR
ncbi:class I SAM-dependent methyltransferase [Ignavigranum ruoffiae]|uniref:tRNA (mnm(5)s(2)U34)-methyltransferase n=1 Tax=Ignavigranum ruoffiae TaxID=89093 RepID=UPI002054C3F6|nr:class I SAM-dependent methyltransferase [Ignavigranum ruoffiae]UPQ85730.1 class I SAM-dependent methyltransferase [Ignavigranum ruoffiae]